MPLSFEPRSEQPNASFPVTVHQPLAHVPVLSFLKPASEDRVMLLAEALHRDMIFGRGRVDKLGRWMHITQKFLISLSVHYRAFFPRLLEYECWVNKGCSSDRRREGQRRAKGDAGHPLHEL